MNRGRKKEKKGKKKKKKGEGKKACLFSFFSLLSFLSFRPVDMHRLIGGMDGWMGKYSILTVL